MQNLKDIIQYREKWKLKNEHYELIGDKAWILEEKKETHAVLKLIDKIIIVLSFIKHYTRTIGVYSPD